MSETLLKLFENPGSLVIVLLIVLVTLGTIIWLVYFLVKSLTAYLAKNKIKGPAGIEIGGSDNSSQPSVNIPENYIQLKVSTFKQIVAACDAAYSEYINRKSDVEKALQTKIIATQNRCFQDAVSKIAVDYSTKQVDPAADLSSETDILQLYLMKDFKKILSDEFKSIMESQAAIMSDTEASENIAKITNTCVMQMRLEINRYKIIDLNILKAIFEAAVPEIKNVVAKAIKDFSAASKLEQEDLLKAEAIRVATIDKQIDIINEK